ncbi:probable GTP diphosphokinase CRSH, chloroplastic [Olea europaea subsp. europaea]|uniref:Probable GTP diphosphokinase CRSH, chloroplastic n=1 Tax=Olea europaea subsp. europaea TaxID=158383 RepID=A0A8S0VKZ5_OLEEU|nr:probable GTP diphosphokinase CRSH, chloroplastic [Olea europaea subsp. europaea]
MELHLQLHLHFNSRPFSKPIILPKCPSISTFFAPILKEGQEKQSRLLSDLSFSRRFAVAEAAEITLEQPGGKMVVELVGAFNELIERMNNTVLSTSSSRLLFKALKLSIPILHTLPPASDGRSPLEKAFSIAVILADLQMDAEVISAGMLREGIEGGAISIYEVKDRIGIGTAHLLHESMRLKNVSSKVEVELMRNLEDRDAQYKTLLNKKLEMGDSSGLIQAYTKELGDRLAMN